VYKSVCYNNGLYFAKKLLKTNSLLLRYSPLNKKQEEISSMILNYLRKNPDAGDTLEGISKWWLESERVHRSVNDVAEALNTLIKKGSVKSDEVKGGSPIYKICKMKNIASQIN
jgi:hypothetical protein